MDIFAQTFMQLALAAGVISAGICAYLGVYVILKRIVFVGIALAELGALGVALGFYFHWPLLLCATIMTFLGVLLFWVPLHLGSLTRESLIGFAYCLAAGLSLIILAKNPAVEAHGVDLISGNLLYAQSGDLVILLLLLVVLGGMHFALFREFLFVSFDRETAQSLRLPAGFYDLLLYMSLGLAISLIIKIVGILFVFASLVIPPMVGLTLCRTTKRIFIASVLTAVLSIPAGLYISFQWDLPSGPAVVAVYGIFLLVVFIIRFLKK